MSFDKKTTIKIAKHRAKKPLDDIEDEQELRLALQAHQALFEHQNPNLDYSKSKLFKNVARYTPALSEGYINSVARLGMREIEAQKTSDPSEDPFDGFAFGAEDLKFTNPDSKLCFYPWALFSGGQGARTANSAISNNWITKTPRDKRVVLLGDSGGYQIQEQSIPFDPQTTPERMLRWLERVADQSMVLDFPTGGVATGALVPHTEMLIAEGVDVFGEAKKAGFSSSYMAALIRTRQNNDYFATNRVPGATNLLNVIQGRNEEESRFWYEQVRDFPFEGWAFAGKHSVHLSITLRRLIQMRDDGKLRPNSYMHFLGVSTFKVGCALSMIQRALRKYTDAKGIQLTFDSKSPVDAMANGYQAIVGYDFGPDRWSVRTEKTNLKKYLGSDVLLADTADAWVAKKYGRHKARSTLGYILRQKDLVGTADPKTYNRVPSALQQAMLVHHNTQALIEGFRKAYRFLDEKSFPDRPESVAHLNKIIRAVFIAKDPFAVIDEWAVQLDALSYEGVFGK
ncbi:hypothetical protein [uncultured Roseobacter sp.]|uniref:hypothetical protein n=1 Tax=uncultured Roseobacter sp. TaxID=114847 RepID=UPI0026127B19|nr:hypothetical protein [uncultured Roseobacter sp.]